jgi:hypothetical protein
MNLYQIIYYINKFIKKVISWWYNEYKSDIIDNNFLTICDLPDSINQKDLSSMIKKYIDSRKDFYKDSGRNIYIEDEFSEYWLEKVTSGKSIGKGSGGMDVKTKSNEGIDATCIIMNNSISNEKSLIQNFTSAGDNLDTLFLEKRDKEAVQMFVTKFSNKIVKTKEKHQLTDLYIVAFVSTKDSVYCVCLKMNIDKIDKIKSEGFGKKTKNIDLTNFIDPKFGKVSLCKSKKRLELRLKKESINHKFAVKMYSM